MLRGIMEQPLMFAPLVAPQSRWKSFLVGWGMQAGLVAAVLAVNVLFPRPMQQAKKYVVMTLVPPVEPMITQTQPVNPRLAIRVKPSPTLPVMETSVAAKLVVPPQVRKMKEAEPEVNAPEIKLASNTPELPKIPDAPPAKMIATNTFVTPSKVMPTTAKPAAEVQTGGFGDPNGVPATGDGKHGVNIALKGSPAFPVGAGFGNGLGGTKGVAGVGTVGNSVVQSSGFDKQVAAVRKPETENVNGPATPVEILFKPRPMYTEEGRKLKIEGEVRLEVRFTAEGQVQVVKVLQGLGYGLDEQALRCAEQIKFKPAMHAGRTVDSTAVVHIIFELAS
jgi:TonB family protein